MKKPALFNLKTGTGEISVHPIDSGKINSIADNIQCMDSFPMNGIPYIIAFEKNTGICHIYRAYDTDGIFLKEIEQTRSVNTSSIAILNTEKGPLCLAYDGSSGIVTFLKITPGLAPVQVYKRNVGTGITTLKTFTYRKQLFFITYNMETGHVSKYEVSVDTSGTISAKEVWNDGWAQEWTRFSFFRLGAENFFIKTNLKYKKVNIDHFMDNAGEGSHPVLNIDAPPQMAGLNNVNAFTGPKGFPFFATYRTNGEVTLNRIYGNCLGWDMEKQFNTDPHRSLMLALTINNENYLLIY